MDVNEKIVQTWLEECKNMFTRTNIDYDTYHRDIDLLAVDIVNNVIWDCEVKIRTGSTKISNSSKQKQNGFKLYINNLFDNQREKLIYTLVPSTIKIYKKFITTKSFFGSRKNTISKWVNKFSRYNVDVIFLDDIINELYLKAIDTKYQSNEIIQTLKILNIGLGKNKT